VSSRRNKSGLLMATELREAPDAVRRQSETLARPLTKLAALLRNSPPRVVVTCARGSSANAATFGKYLIERHLGIPVADAAPSIMSVYRRSLMLEGQLFLAISQSGRSEDLIESASGRRVLAPSPWLWSTTRIVLSPQLATSSCPWRPERS